MKKLLFILTFLLPLFAWAQTDSTTNNTNNDDILEVVEEPPTFPGGEDAMKKFIRDNLVYPPTAVKDSMQGRVIVLFIVERDGSVSDVKAVKTFDEACGNEAVRVVKLMKWNPGRQRGHAVRTRLVIPFTFKLK